LEVLTKNCIYKEEAYNEFSNALFSSINLSLMKKENLLLEIMWASGPCWRFFFFFLLLSLAAFTPSAAAEIPSRVSDLNPSVITYTTSCTGAHGAFLNGKVINLNDNPVISRGFEYGTSSLYGQRASTSRQMTAGTFLIPLSDLACGTTYHYRAYVTGATSTIYGQDKSFTTNSCEPSLVQFILKRWREK